MEETDKGATESPKTKPLYAASAPINIPGAIPRKRYTDDNDRDTYASTSTMSEEVIQSPAPSSSLSESVTLGNSNIAPSLSSSSGSTTFGILGTPDFDTNPTEPDPELELEPEASATEIPYEQAKNFTQAEENRSRVKITRGQNGLPRRSM